MSLAGRELSGKVRTCVDRVDFISCIIRWVGYWDDFTWVLDLHLAAYISLCVHDRQHTSPDRVMIDESRPESSCMNIE